MLWEEVGKDQGRGGVPGSGEGGAEETWKGLHLLPTVSSRFYQILILITSAIFKKKKKNIMNTRSFNTPCVYFHSAQLSKQAFR